MLVMGLFCMIRMQYICLNTHYPSPCMQDLGRAPVGGAHLMNGSSPERKSEFANIGLIR